MNEKQFDEIIEFIIHYAKNVDDLEKIKDMVEYLIEDYEEY